MPSKIDKEETEGLVSDSEKLATVIEYCVQQLPRTPGRDCAQRGVDEIKRGLSEIRREAEL